MPEIDGFRGLDIKRNYESKRGQAIDILTSFLVPVLSRSVEFSRTVGYFSSSMLTAAAAGMSHFVHNGGTIRLLVGAQVYEHDLKALTGKIAVDGGFGERLASELIPPDEIAKKRLEVLAWLLKEGRLEIRIAIAIDENGSPLLANPHEPPVPYWHEKVGYFLDKYRVGISYTGSINDSLQALKVNKENCTVFPSWKVPDYYQEHVDGFEAKWNGKVDDFAIMPIPEAAHRRLLTLAPDTPPARRDVLEPKVRDKAQIATVLDLAPRLTNAQALAEATIGTKLQPHQRQVYYRLADQYPRSWIVADEVGLGKTISSGMSLRRLMISERVKRALILAPANTCANWQNELFEKFGLWVPRLKDGVLLGVHPSLDRKLRAGENPFLQSEILIASSHLARRSRYRDLLIQASGVAPYDLIIVDEAHHARKDANEQSAASNQLLRLLEQIRQHSATRALWLLTATPLQMHPLELFMLLRQVGLGKPFDDFGVFERYYAELTRGEAANFEWLNQKLQAFSRPLDTDEESFLESLTGTLTADNIERIRRFGTSHATLDETIFHPAFAGDAKVALHKWLRIHGPVERYMTRHTRETLRQYQREGKLDKPLAIRDVKSINIEFRPEETLLYHELERFIDRLTEAHGTTTQAKFILSIYQRRLTSSWAAIESSLKKRINNEALLIDDDTDDAGDDATSDSDTEAHTVDQGKVVPLTDTELEEMKRYVFALNTVRDGDTKFKELEKCIRDARNSEQRIIVFTQYTDTLDYLRDKLVGSYGFCMATYTGDGGRYYQNGEWEKISKEDLVDRTRTGNVQILLATDAAAEGLNLQSCSYLVNYDMPWNPMKAEQRIGRVDRLGQTKPIVTIRNFFVSEHERKVYRALAERIRDFNRFIGGLPPILGVVEGGFIRNPLDETQREPETMDPLPQPNYPPSPVQYDDFVRLVRDELGVTLQPTSPSHVVTWEPERASRDRDSWRAAASYGHPAIQDAIRSMALPVAIEPLAFVEEPTSKIASITRGDRTPAEELTSIQELDQLGEPVSLADAQALAQEIVKSKSAEYRAHCEEIRSLQNQGGLDALKADYIRLVHDIVELRIAYSAQQTGLQLSPYDAWNTFIREEAQYSRLPYLESIRSALGLETQQMLIGVNEKSRPVSEATYRRQIGELEPQGDRILYTWKAMYGARSA